MHADCILHYYYARALTRECIDTNERSYDRVAGNFLVNCDTTIRILKPAAKGSARIDALIARVCLISHPNVTDTAIVAIAPQLSAG